MNKVKRAIALIACAALCCVGLASCGGSSAPAANDKPAVIGTLATEDILPMWIAEDEKLFDQAGVSATVQVFQSAQELSTAIAAKEVDIAMTDAQVAATLTAGGTDMTLEWVTLGADASQGRFGIMTSPESGITSLSQLAGVPIGVGSNTVPEYVMDRLMLDAGVPADQIVSEELKKLPVRFEMMVNNQVAAAALPASLLALGEAKGMVLVADDTQGQNISQSVMAARTEWANENADTLKKLEDVWDKAVDEVNASPEKYRQLLVTKASLSDAIASTYSISTYPKVAKPTSQMIDPVLEWMTQKGYLTISLQYDPATGSYVK